MKRYLYYWPLILQKVCFLIYFVLHKIFVKIEIRGRENLKGLKKPVIFASNHTSELDVTITPLMLGLFSRFYPLYYVSDPKDKFKSFGWRNYIYGGIFFNILGGYPIHSGFHDYEISLVTFIELLEDGQSVFIFPEGKRTADGKLGKARGGLGFMVYEMEVPVVPVAINTFYDISWKKYFTRSRKVIVTILPPIFPDKLIKTDTPTVEDYRHATKEILKRIDKELAK